MQAAEQLARGSNIDTFRIDELGEGELVPWHEVLGGRCVPQQLPGTVPELALDLRPGYPSAECRHTRKLQERPDLERSLLDSGRARSREQRLDEQGCALATFSQSNAVNVAYVRNRSFADLAVADNGWRTPRLPASA